MKVSMSTQLEIFWQILARNYGERVPKLTEGNFGRRASRKPQPTAKNFVCEEKLSLFTNEPKF
jgi:hypothetical protein